jgi:hypothetical protein
MEPRGSLPHSQEPAVAGVVTKNRLCRLFRNIIIFYGQELLAPRPTPRLENHPLSGVRDCLFNVFAATLHNWRPFLQPQPEDAPCRGDRNVPPMLHTHLHLHVTLKVRLYGSSFRASSGMRLEADWSMQGCTRQTCAHGQTQVVTYARHIECASPSVTLCSKGFCGLIFVVAA